MLFLGQAADEKAVLGLGHNVAVQAFYHHGLFFGGMHKAVPAAEEADVFANRDVVVFICPR